MVNMLKLSGEYWLTIVTRKWSIYCSHRNCWA